MATKTFTISELAVYTAKTQLNLDEDENNFGDAVKRYLSSVNINFAASWCMAFVYWCYQQTFDELSMPNPLIKTGGVLRQWNEIDKKYKSKTPKVGSIFIMDYGKGLGHTGIVERIDGDKLYTIEGNTNDEGSREGYEVCRRERSVSKCVGFINLA